MSDADFYESRAKALEEDIAMFGPAGDDLQRLAALKQKVIECREAEDGQCGTA